jgi:hypothetical protein
VVAIPPPNPRLLPAVRANRLTAPIPACPPPGRLPKTFGLDKQDLQEPGWALDRINKMIKIKSASFCHSVKKTSTRFGNGRIQRQLENLKEQLCCTS